MNNPLYAATTLLLMNWDCAMRQISTGCTIIALIDMASCAAKADSDVLPLDYFLHAYGPAARPSMILGWVFTAIAIAVCIIIALLLLAAILRKRPMEDPQKIHHGGHGPRWVMIGTGISAGILFAMAIYALVILNETAAPQSKPTLTITVTGYDWWWKVEYENEDPAKAFETANEIHIPTGAPILLKLKSADVIHAFWVPRLAGKTQMIPGQSNRQWLEADQPGIYQGQCTQFCGLQHAHMAFEVTAQNPADFEAWQAAQRNPAAMPSDADAIVGQHVFMNRCSACHAVRGTDAMGEHAPNLTHLGSRRLIAAGLLSNTPDHVMNWVAHAQELKPGARMPDIALSPQESAALSAYLATLK
jgi:cytochrome c oxidase subunit II